MTKIDKDNFEHGQQMPVMYNDAHASLRGFANSKLTSSVVFSAGMNPRLYSYLEEFEDFYPDNEGKLKKKIILKVSDFRSAMIQGNFLAKKGLWVSEYRIESGLNCGGHAFATEGLLMGPILQEFKDKKSELLSSAYGLMSAALERKGRRMPDGPLPLKVSFQGGVGTSEEHSFLLSEYQLDSVGWGSPFLMVPEATSVDEETRNLLARSQEDDYYLSNISPLGVPFNTVKGTTNELIKKSNIERDRYGSSCPKKFLALSKEMGPEGVCTASTKYQKVKLDELETQRLGMDPILYQKKKDKITEKACLCVGLANSALIEQGIPLKGEKQGVVVCPGPNLAFFDKPTVSLVDMIKHIYGGHSILPDERRPNVVINELKIYVDYLKKEIGQFTDELTKAQIKKWKGFKDNLQEGVAYYENLISSTSFFKKTAEQISWQLAEYKEKIAQIEIPEIVSAEELVMA